MIHSYLHLFSYLYLYIYICVCGSISLPGALPEVPRLGGSHLRGKPTGPFVGWLILLREPSETGEGSSGQAKYPETGNPSVLEGHFFTSASLPAKAMGRTPCSPLPRFGAVALDLPLQRTAKKRRAVGHVEVVKPHSS